MLGKGKTVGFAALALLAGGELNAQAVVDSDGDSIPDTVETNGDKLADGTVYDLKAQGASPTQKDVFVRYDWTPNREPSTEVIRRVTEAYAAAPATLPDFTPGIKLHLIRGQEIPSQGDIGVTAQALQTIRDTYFKEKYSFPFHYVVFTDFLVGHDASGVSPDIPGLNFVVSMGVIKNNTPLKEAGTLMHELGHNLGLQHGGDEGMNYKPNYLSVMNYLYQFQGFQRAPGSGQTERVLDYARIATSELDERNLDERVGFRAVDAETSSYTSYNPSFLKCPVGIIGKRLFGCSEPTLVGQFPGAIDFNGVRGPVDARVSADLNGNHRRDIFRPGIDDWASLKFHGIPDPTIKRFVVDNEDEDPTCPPPPDDAVVASGPESVPPPLDESDEPGPAPQPDPGPGPAPQPEPGPGPTPSPDTEPSPTPGPDFPQDPDPGPGEPQEEPMFPF